MAGSVIQGCFPHGLRLPVQARMANNAAVPLPPQLAHSFATGGQPLEAAVRQCMESAFGQSFGDVRIHVGHHAQSLGARAFTYGSHIYFAPGHYAPDSAEGRKVLAYELAHVVQQRTGRVHNPFGTGIAVVRDPRLEAEAERISERVRQTKMSAPVQRITTPPPVSGATRVSPGTYRIAAREGAHVGSVLVHDSGDAVTVTHLQVRREHRKHGHGLELMTSAAQVAQQLGKQKVILSSADDGSGKLTRWYRGMGFVQTGVNRRGEAQLEAPVTRVINGAAQMRMRSAPPLAAVQAKMHGRGTIQRAAPALVAMTGQQAADAIVNWLNAQGLGGASNYTVGVMTGTGNLVLGKPNGLAKAPKSKDMLALQKQIVAAGWNVGRSIYTAQKFTGDGASNHSEMCVIAAAGAGNLSYIICTASNCPFCAAQIAHHNIPNGNAGLGKDQMAWVHPTEPIAYGQSSGKLAAQLAELAAINAGTLAARNAVEGVKLHSNPQGGMTLWM